MEDKVIDFNLSKAKLLSKKFPNVSNIQEEKKKPVLLASNMALDKFQDIFYKFQEYVNGDTSIKEVKLDEVLVYFNRYFDELYKEFVFFDDERVERLKEAMDYAMLSSGKRLRPFLMFISYYFCKGNECYILSPFMLAIELIHTFSLIHDDLPAIDNDTLRRGKATVWKKYGEDLGILVGDSLMMEASTILIESLLEFSYTILGTHAITSAVVLLRLAGLEGMISGEVYDVMNTKNKNLTLDDISYMYDKKTTALLTAAITIGGNMAGGIEDKLEYIEKLSAYIGEAYQIKDDLLEIESSTEKIGKSVDSDKDNEKVTYVSIVGVKNAKKRLDDLTRSALDMVDKMMNDKNAKEAKVFKRVIGYLMSREK